MNQKFFDIQSIYHLGSDQWYQLALDQGEEQLRAIHSIIDTLTNKLYWLFAIQLAIISGYVGFLVSAVAPGEAIPHNSIILIFVGFLSICPLIAAAFLCVRRLNVASIPVNGCAPRYLVHPSFFTEENKDYLFKASAFSRLRDLDDSIDLAIDIAKEIGEGFENSLRWAIAAVLAGVVLFSLGFVLIALVP